jgi:hypothetical protein
LVQRPCSRCAATSRFLCCLCLQHVAERSASVSGMLQSAVRRSVAWLHGCDISRLSVSTLKACMTKPCMSGACQHCHHADGLTGKAFLHPQIHRQGGELTRQIFPMVCAIAPAQSFALRVACWYMAMRHPVRIGVSRHTPVACACCSCTPCSPCHCTQGPFCMTVAAGLTLSLYGIPGPGPAIRRCVARYQGKFGFQQRACSLLV